MENQIFQDLKGLHLSGMAECWQNLQEMRKHQEIVVTGINKYSEIGNVSAVKMESVIQ